MKFEQKYIDIINQFIAKNNNTLNSKKLKVFLNNNFEVKQYYENILKQYPTFIKLYNVVWASINNFDVEQYKCKYCGKLLNLKNVTFLKEYCGAKCASNDPELIKRRQQTISKDPEFYKKRQEKIVKTNIQKYGCKAPAQNEKIRNKAKQTVAKDPDHWKKRQKKTIKTNLEKYGVQNTWNLKSAKQNSLTTKSKQTFESFKKFDKLISMLFTKEEFLSDPKQELTWKCNICGTTFKQKNMRTQINSEFYNLPRCPTCYPEHISKFEAEIRLFLQSLTNKTLIFNSKDVIKPFELDITIPDLQLAIECNGIHWHSTDIRKNSNYHKMKTEMCQKAGYRLIQIFEHEWNEKQQIIKEKIKSIICNDIPSIYARKCQIRQLDTYTTKNFLKDYHIQGSDSSSVRIGLFNQDELVAVMTFCKPRFNKNYEWQLSRYATSKRVIGGASKLMKYFQKKYSPNSIITYCDRRFSTGNMYKKLNFTLNHISEPNYFWTKSNIVLPRYQTQKHKLKNLLGQNFDQKLSQAGNMEKCGYQKIFDCGNLVFTKTF